MVQSELTGAQGRTLLDFQSASAGLVAFAYTATGAYAVLIATASGKHLPPAFVDSWTLAAYGLGGILTLVASLYYKQPIGIGWTVAGTVVVAASSGSIQPGELVAAYGIAGIIVTATGVLRIFSRLLARTPEGVVLGTVVAIFFPLLKLGALSIIQDPVLCLPLFVIAVAVAISPASRRVPPALVAVLSGVVILAIEGQLPTASTLGSHGLVSRIVIVPPQFQGGRVIVLAITLAASVLVVHTAQGVFILKFEGYRVSTDSLVSLCGIASFPMAMMGCVPACVMGPSVAMLNSGGRKATRYHGGVVFGVLLVAFGLFSPTVGELLRRLSPEFVQLIAAISIAPFILTCTYRIIQTPHFRAPGGLAALAGVVGVYTFGAVLGVVVALTLGLGVDLGRKCVLRGRGMAFDNGHRSLDPPVGLHTSGSTVLGSTSLCITRGPVVEGRCSAAGDAERVVESDEES